MEEGKQNHVSASPLGTFPMFKSTHNMPGNPGHVAFCASGSAPSLGLDKEAYLFITHLHRTLKDGGTDVPPLVLNSKVHNLLNWLRKSNGRHG